MPVDSLADIARRACGRYSHVIQDVGDLPYDMVRPILLRLKDHNQLYHLEQRCPQLIGHDAEVWLQFIKRDIPDWESKPHQPSNPQNWHKVYRKLKQEAEQEVLEGKARLEAALSVVTENPNRLAPVIHTSSMHLPGRAPDADPVLRYRRILDNDGPVPSSLEKSLPRGKAAPSKPGHWGSSKPLSAIDKIRRDVKNAQRASRGTLRGMRQVSAAPTTFVEDLRRQKARIASTAPHSPTTLASTSEPTASDQRRAILMKDRSHEIMRDREARLRAFTTGHPVCKSPTQPKNQDGDTEPVSPRLNMSFLEDDELMKEGDVDEDHHIFGDLPKVQPHSRPSHGRGSPQRVLKRRVPASIFHEPKRRNSVVS